MGPYNPSNLQETAEAPSGGCPDVTALTLSPDPLRKELGGGQNHPGPEAEVHCIKWLIPYSLSGVGN